LNRLCLGCDSAYACVCSDSLAKHLRGASTVSKSDHTEEWVSFKLQKMRSRAKGAACEDRPGYAACGFKLGQPIVEAQFPGE
jgi:hypothetical protein